MEKNNLHKAYIYIIAVFAIGIAMANIIAFFNGVGFAFIGASVLLVLALCNIIKDESIKKRFGDIFVLLVLEFLMFIVLFFAYDFNLNGITNKFPMVMRNICAIYSLFAMGYVLFRYISELKGVKYVFVEYMLGNYTPQTREKKVKPSKAEIKKRKELENGTLEPKPSSLEPVEVKESTEEATAEEVNMGIEESVEEEIASTPTENETDSTLTENSNNVESTTETTQTNNSSVGNRTNFWY